MSVVKSCAGLLTTGQATKIRQQLQSFVDEFAEDLGRSERRPWCGRYLEGLLREGEHKSIKPMAARVAGWRAGVAAVRQSESLGASGSAPPAAPENAGVRLGCRVLVLDDTSPPKQGRHSVGIARQYRGAVGKIANCQSIVTWHWIGTTGPHWPLAAQLYLPDEWTDDGPRMNQAGVLPAEQRFREKWRTRAR